MSGEIGLWDRIKCFFGCHDLIVSEDEQRLLDDAMKSPIAQMFRLDTLYDGTKIVFKICKRCGVKR